MKTIVLSDFTGEQLTRAQQKKQETYHSALRTYRRSEADWSRRVDDVYQRAVAAYEGEIQRWNKMAWFSRLLYGLVHSWPATLLCVVVMGAGLFALVNGIAFWLAVVGLIVIPGVALLYFPGQEPTPPSQSNVERRFGEAPGHPVLNTTRSEREEVLEAGREGERRVADGLASQLDDQWIMLSGYNGPGGEIDHILVGPLGACALEVKYLNGNVTVNGDSWVISRYDNYGNAVEQYQPVTDKTGHSPSQQLNRAVKPLETFLRRRKVLRRMVTAVVLSHDKSFIESTRSQTVDNITAIPHLRVRDLFSRHDQPLTPQASTDVVRHIQRDHEFQKNKSNDKAQSRQRRRTPRTTQRG